MTQDRISLYLAKIFPEHRPASLGRDEHNPFALRLSIAAELEAARLGCSLDELHAVEALEAAAAADRTFAL